MKLVFNVTSELGAWLQSTSEVVDDTPPDTEPDTDAHQVHWNCQILTRDDVEHATLVAVESFSHFCVILPLSTRQTTIQIQEMLLIRWGNELAYHCAESSVLTDTEIQQFIKQFMQKPKAYVWVRDHFGQQRKRFDRVVNKVTMRMENAAQKSLSKEESIELGDQLNLKNKSSKYNMWDLHSNSPVSRLLADGLFRFGKGLAKEAFDHTPDKHFPCPHGSGRIQMVNQSDSRSGDSSNVIYFDTFKKKR